MPIKKHYIKKKLIGKNFIVLLVIVALVNYKCISPKQINLLEVIKEIFLRFYFDTFQK
jgi:hypothetical protein